MPFPLTPMVTSSSVVATVTVPPSATVSVPPAGSSTGPSTAVSITTSTNWALPTGAEKDIRKKVKSPMPVKQSIFFVFITDPFISEMLCFFMTGYVEPAMTANDEPLDTCGTRSPLNGRRGCC
jgi:hypothetical protein